MPNQNNDNNNKNQGRKDNTSQKGNQQQEQERTPQRQQQGQQGQFGGQGPQGGRVPGAQTGLDGDQNKKGSAIDNEDEVEDEDLPENIEGGRKQGNENEQRRP
jgi:hypothetical protein